MNAFLNDPALDDGQFLEPHFYSQVSPRDHHSVRGFYDAVQIGHRLLVFDLRHDAGDRIPLLQTLSKHLDVGRVTHETHPNKVGAHLHRHLDVSMIFFGQSGEIHANSRQVDMAT